MNARSLLYILFLSIPSFIYSQQYLPGDNELFIMPTAYTMPVSNSYFSDYELIFLNYSYAVTPTTHISILSLFPITTQFYETFTFGIKQHIITYNSLQSSLYGVFTPKSSSYSIGDVISYGAPKRSFHLSLAYVKYSEQSDADWVYMLGFRIDPSQNTSIIMEYENANSLVNEDFKGLFTIGVRIRSTHMSWEIAGLRPLGSSGSLLFIPLLKVGYYFD
jgi:hypothetical protein